MEPDIIMTNEVASAKAGGPNDDFLREENLRGHFNNGVAKPEKGDKPGDDEKPATGDKPKGTTGPESKAPPAQPGDDQQPATPVAAEIHEGESGKDPQLDRALELLKSWKVFKALTSQQSTETG